MSNAALSSGRGDQQMVVKGSMLDNTNSKTLANVNGFASKSSLIQAISRTTDLLAPVIQLSGHSGEVFCAKFDPNGSNIASGSMDRSIMLWRTFGDCENYGTLVGHKGAVLDLQWSRDARILFSASADMHLASWDLGTGNRIRRYVGHQEIINSMDISKRGEELLLSGSDDGSIGIWDTRTKTAVSYIETDFPVTAVALSEVGNEIYSGGIDNDIRVWDMRQREIVYSMLGHMDTVTSLRISPDAQSLLSNSMDSTVRTWDIRPFAPTERLIQTYDGAPIGMEKNLIRASWSSDGKRIAAGAGDGTVVVWNSATGKLQYKLPGHKGSVNCAEFSPSSDPIIVSGSSDRTMILGELK
ncbi:U5 small nuclear ribonucleoprotein 40 kDa protein [Golovinomyces cichoracearum]|uniref:U5 small nuclear ribonucleoprotein 40 kDa protein n=1 Tax=Golovinomyces cichoracearum TaxID=62708 RepID=A0A420HLL1_9PEZI|nr:U5 small nuclear ribonucleoprotein 40 kDa protein [Golovinomyces cichoracearum]